MLSRPHFWADNSLSFDIFPHTHVNSGGDSSRSAVQFSPLVPTAQAFFSPITSFPVQTSETPRGFTNRNRKQQLSPSTTQVIKQTTSSPENNDDFQLSQSAISSTTKKRNSADIAIRPLKPKKRARNPFLLTCSDPACHNRSFADEPNLQRHAREVHGVAQYYCPVETCERYTRGFKRRDNCVNHQKRSHGGVLFLRGVERQEEADVNGNHEGMANGSSAGDEDEDEEEQGDTPPLEGAQRERAKSRMEPIISRSVVVNGVKGLSPAEALMRKMDNLRALLGRKMRIEEEIARARAELQEALQP